MIPVHTGLAQARPHLLAEAKRLDRLVHDLRAIADGTGPTEADIDAAPVLNEWRFCARTSRNLLGTVHDHPHLMNGPACTTKVYAYDIERRWARTLSRYYVLGDRAPRGGDRG